MPQFGYVNMGFGSHASKGVEYQSMTFTSSGELKVNSGGVCDVLVIAGGGGGGEGHIFGVGSQTAGAGGGGGAFRIFSNITLADGGTNNTEYEVTIGGGGNNGNGSQSFVFYRNSSGDAKWLSEDISDGDNGRPEGGGRGGSPNNLSSDNKLANGYIGGSGGGGAFYHAVGIGTGGAVYSVEYSKTLSSSGADGNVGGDAVRLSSSSAYGGAGGGGGASGAGQDGQNPDDGTGLMNGGDGGAGRANNFSTGSDVLYAGGGGGAGSYAGGSGNGGHGNGGGGDAGEGNANGGDGTANTGGGAGAAGSANNNNGSGGSGIVVFRFLSGAITFDGDTDGTLATYTA